jgi:hypothetical protein
MTQRSKMCFLSFECFYSVHKPILCSSVCKKDKRIEGDLNYCMIFYLAIYIYEREHLLPDGDKIIV